jgi:hypothetical protein
VEDILVPKYSHYYRYVLPKSPETEVSDEEPENSDIDKRKAIEDAQQDMCSIRGLTSNRVAASRIEDRITGDAHQAVAAFWGLRAL